MSTPNAINIPQNIEQCKSNMEKLRTNATASEQEFFRVEGSLRVFASLKELGIDNIPVPEKPVIDNNEVIDTKEHVPSGP